MKRRFKVGAVSIAFLLVISIGLNIVFAVNQGAEPGSDQDPIVSKSYVDAAFAQLSSKIQSLLEQNTQLTSKLAEQEKTVKSLQEELKAVKTGAGAGSGTSGNTGTGNTGATASIGKGVVNVAVLNVRAQPNTTSKIVTKTVKNETLTLVSKSGDWYKITTSKGVSGYVMGKFVTVKK